MLVRLLQTVQCFLFLGGYYCHCLDIHLRPVLVIWIFAFQYVGSRSIGNSPMIGSTEFVQEPSIVKHHMQSSAKSGPAASTAEAYRSQHEITVTVCILLHGFACIYVWFFCWFSCYVFISMLIFTYWKLILNYALRIFLFIK